MQGDLTHKNPQELNLESLQAMKSVLPCQSAIWESGTPAITAQRKSNQSVIENCCQELFDKP